MVYLTYLGYLEWNGEEERNFSLGIRRRVAHLKQSWKTRLQNHSEGSSRFKRVVNPHSVPLEGSTNKNTAFSGKRHFDWMLSKNASF